MALDNNVETKVEEKSTTTNPAEVTQPTPAPEQAAPAASTAATPTTETKTNTVNATRTTSYNIDWEKAAATTQRLMDALAAENVDLEGIKGIDTTELENILKQIKDTQVEQQNNQIDYNVDTGTKNLERAEEDAAKQFQTQRDQTEADSQKALDNQALYAQARGDNGGIGQAQYDIIQATRATNLRTVNDAQVKLSTDTARQIEDLRAQGEFKKADSLLAITQSYLSELNQLKQWGMQMNLSVDEFNKELEKWTLSFNQQMKQAQIDAELSAAQLTGAFSDGTATMQATLQINEALAAAGEQMLAMGLTPTAEQLAAMGWTSDQYSSYKSATSGGGGGGGYGYGGPANPSGKVWTTNDLVNDVAMVTRNPDASAAFARDSGVSNAAQVQSWANEFYGGSKSVNGFF